MKIKKKFTSFLVIQNIRPYLEGGSKTDEETNVNKEKNGSLLSFQV